MTAGRPKAPQSQYVRLDFSVYSGGVKFAVDQAHFAKIITGQHGGKDDLPPTLVVGNDAGTFCDQHKQGVRFLPYSTIESPR